jgi:hypothetical protein
MLLCGRVFDQEVSREFVGVFASLSELLGGPKSNHVQGVLAAFVIEFVGKL